MIQKIKPNVDQFRELRKQQVANILDQSRKAFKDKDLKNEYVYNELRDKLSKQWDNANGETLPGIKNLDLVTSDEHILGLIRDGLKYRDRPTAKQAGTSIAALTRKSGVNTNTAKAPGAELDSLREQAKKGGKEGIRAADNLLMQRLTQIRSASRGGR